MKSISNLFVKTEEFADYILKYIESEDIEKAFKATNFYAEENSEQFFNAFQYGILWASILMQSSNVHKYMLVDKENNNE